MEYKRLCCIKHEGVQFSEEFSEGKQIISKCLNKKDECHSRFDCLYAGGGVDPFFDLGDPIHSDFLIYWTGKDIDNKYDPIWERNNDVRLNKEIIVTYLKRLKNILDHGLWMNDESTEHVDFDGVIKFERPSFSRICFTELKLSEARTHAKRFGRLGLGVKRMFVLAKGGLPMVYFRPGKMNWFFKPYFERSLKGDQKFPKEAYWASYLKSMNEGSTDGFVQYKNFDESEWRIIYSPEAETRFGKIHGIEEVEKLARRKELYDYLNDEKIKKSKWPKYVLPLDYWFSIIIYPSLAVKVEAERDPDIRRLINKIKPTLEEKGLSPKSSASYEQFSKPFEIDLDACRNF